MEEKGRKKKICEGESGDERTGKASKKEPSAEGSMKKEILKKRKPSEERTSV